MFLKILVFTAVYHLQDATKTMFSLLTLVNNPRRSERFPSVSLPFRAVFVSQQHGSNASTLGSAWVLLK